MQDSVGHLVGGLGAGGCCQGGASSPHLLGLAPALTGHHHGADEGHKQHGDEPQVHLWGSGCRVRGAHHTLGVPWASPTDPPVPSAWCRTSTPCAGPPLPPHSCGAGSSQGAAPHPSMGQDPFPVGQDPMSLCSRIPNPPGAGTHVEGVSLEWPLHQRHAGVLQQRHQCRQCHGQAIELPEVLRGEPAPPRTASP